MFCIYILQSTIDSRHYYGFTEKDAHQRLKEHNSSKSSHTGKYKPWKLIWYAYFTSKEKARDFERYLKTPSGHAFSKKRFL